MMKSYTAAATVECEEFGFHATSLTGKSNFKVLIQRPVDTSHSLTLQSCEPVVHNTGLHDQLIMSNPTAGEI